jgi:hypothetical protein
MTLNMIYKNYKLIKTSKKKKKKAGRVCGSTTPIISQIGVAQPTPKIHFRSSSSKLYVNHCFHAHNSAQLDHDSDAS